MAVSVDHEVWIEIGVDSALANPVVIAAVDFLQRVKLLKTKNNPIFCCNNSSNETTKTAEHAHKIKS